VQASDTRPAHADGMKLVLAWGFVGIPPGWDVVQICLNALKLFQ
jgi:hypothetical protein